MPDQLALGRQILEEELLLRPSSLDFGNAIGTVPNNGQLHKSMENKLEVGVIAQMPEVMLQNMQIYMALQDYTGNMLIHLPQERSLDDDDDQRKQPQQQC